MAGGSYYGPGSRWTPDPRRTRQAVLAALATGFIVGLAGVLLPLTDVHLTLTRADAAQWSLGLFIGGLLGGIAGRWLARTAGGIRSVLTAGIFSTVAALGWLFAAADAETLAPPAGLLGVGAGLAAVGTSYALDGVLSAGRAASALDLAAAFFGFGAASCAALAYVFRRQLPFDEAVLSLALVLVVVSVLIRLRSAPPDPVASAVLAHRWHDILRATRVLLGIGMTLQAALWGAAAYWLGFYAVRNLGSAPTSAAALAALFWSGWILGRTFVLRARRMGLASAVVVVGFGGGLACLFLLNTVAYSGAVAGAALLGSASGWLQGLVQTMANRQDVTRAMVGRFFGGGVMASLFSGVVTGVVMLAFGVRGIVWFIAAVGALLSVCVMLLAVEARLAQTPAEV